MTALQQAAQSPRRYKSLRTIGALILREMSTTYGKSPGGYLWAVLEPVGMITVMSVIFSAGFRTPALGTNFAIFFASGWLPFMVYTSLQSRLQSALSFSKNLLAYPAVRYTDAIIARSVLCLITQIMVYFLVMTGLHVVYDLDTILRIGPVLVSIAMAALLGFGVGTVNCYLGTVYPVWGRVWRIVSRPMFLISGVIFLYEVMPGKMRDILWYNPLMHVTGLARRGFYVTYDGTWIMPVYGFGVGIVLSALGVLLLYRHHKRLIELL